MERDRKDWFTTITYISNGDYLQNIDYNDTNNSHLGELVMSVLINFCTQVYFCE